MKNLVLLGERRNVVEVRKDDEDNSNKRDEWICDLAYDPNVLQNEIHYDGFGQHGVGGDATIPPAIFLLTPAGNLVATSSMNSVVWECNLNEVCEDESCENEKGWFSVTFVDELDCLVCLSHSGAIVTVHPQYGSPSLIGEFENGLMAGSWSPDYDILALFTYNEEESMEASDETPSKVPVLMTMNSQFEILAEVNLDPVIENDGVAMRWRPSGTSIALSLTDAADQTRRIRTYQRDSLELESIGRSEDGSGKTVPNLSIAPSALAWATGGCSNSLATVQKRGKRKNAKENIVFFEPNGLRHRDFKLRDSNPSEKDLIEKVDTLAWNSQSDLLAVVLNCTMSSKDSDKTPMSYGKLQLWHRSNYHWYLKYEFKYDQETPSTVSCVKFHEEKPYHLSVALRSTNQIKYSLEWRTYEFQWDWSVVSPTGTATVIDGNTINFTPLSIAMVPPPMYAAQITLQSNVCEVVRAPSHCNLAGDLFVAKLSNDTLIFCGDPSLAIHNQGKELAKSNMIAKYNIPQIFGSAVDISQICELYSLRQILVVNATTSSNEFDDWMQLRLVAVGSKKENINCDFLIEIVVSLHGQENGLSKISWSNGILLEQKVLRIANWCDDSITYENSESERFNGVLIEFVDGSFVEYSSFGIEVTGEIKPSVIDPMLEPCPWVSAIYSPDTKAEENLESNGQMRLVVGLSERSRLYCGERLLSSACSSFSISPTHGFLCHVTLGSRSQMLFVPLTVLASFDPLMGSDDNLEILGRGYEPRTVERGAKLVSVLPSQPTAIIQLPRGNLEGTFPRALVLPYVMKLIDSGNFGKALDIMRKQKVDLNLIVDMNPISFLENGGTEKLISQVQNMDYLNLFISSLVNDDITIWKFPVPDWSSQFRSIRDVNEPMSFDFAEKVNKVCQKTRTAMIEAEISKKLPICDRAISEGHFLLPILSTFAKENPPKLEAALDLIRNNASKSKQKSSKSKKSPLLSEEAQSSIQYLAFLADYELLYNTALGMYDYDLAKAVARNSQMDPKVYLPMLKKFVSMPEFLAKFEVDVKLKRFESALTHLTRHREDHGNVEFTKCLDFIKDHKLYKHGLSLFSEQPVERRSIMVALGENLVVEGKNDVALALFLSVDPKDYNGAKNASRRCGDWKTYFALSIENRVVGKNEDPKHLERLKREVAYEIAEEVSTEGSGAMKTRDGCAAASTILLDYCEDSAEAIDLLIAGQWWFEARRIALLHNRGNLVKRVVDSAVSYGTSLLQDFESRIESFNETNERYSEVLEIRRNAHRDGDLGDGNLDVNHDDSASMFSMASNASASSLRSNMSGSSVGSVHSVSSVISAGAVSTFSITGEIDAYKHKSKYNNIGKKKKKKKKKTKRERKQKIKPGSVEELNSLVDKLKADIVTDDVLEVIVETVRFLVQVGKRDIAKDIFYSYKQLILSVNKSQETRITKMKKEREIATVTARKEGQNFDDVVLDCEKEVDDLKCKDFPPFLEDLFQYL